MKKKTENMVQEVENTWSRMAMVMSAMDPNRTGFLPNLQEAQTGTPGWWRATTSPSGGPDLLAFQSEEWVSLKPTVYWWAQMPGHLFLLTSEEASKTLLNLVEHQSTSMNLDQPWWTLMNLNEPQLSFVESCQNQAQFQYFKQQTVLLFNGCVFFFYI